MKYLLVAAVVAAGGVGSVALSSAESSRADGVGEASAPDRGQSQTNAVAAADDEEPTATISIEVSGLNNSHGQVVAKLFWRAKRFPMKSAWRTTTATISGGKARLQFTVPYGTYAISVFHDENKNRELDTNWLGMPKEGVGSSNNAKGRMGPPKFEDAKFDLGADGATQNIKVAYL